MREARQALVGAILERGERNQRTAGRVVQLFAVKQTSPLIIESIDSGVELHDDELISSISLTGLAVDDTLLVVRKVVSDEVLWIVVAAQSDSISSGGGSINWRRVWDATLGYVVGDLVRYGPSTAYINILPIDAPSGGGDPVPAYGWNTETPRASQGWLSLNTEVLGNTTGKAHMQENDSPGDQWIFEVTTYGHFTISTRDPSGTGWDSYLYLEDATDGPSGNIIWYDDDSGPGAMSMITGRPLTPGLYVVRMQGYRNTEFGAYGLTLTSTDGGVVAVHGSGTNPTPDVDTTHWDLVAGGGTGTAGSVIRHGVGPPDPSLGNIGDFYIDIADPSHPYLYGPKT